MSPEFDFAWIVPRESEFGREIARFSEDDWTTFREQIVRGFGVSVEIDEVDEPGHDFNETYFDGPAFLFKIRLLRLGLINNIEELAHNVRTNHGT